MKPLIDSLSNLEGLVFLNTLAVIIGGWANLIQIGIFPKPNWSEKTLVVVFFVVALLCLHLVVFPPILESVSLRIGFYFFLIVLGLGSISFSGAFVIATYLITSPNTKKRKRNHKE